MECYNIMQLACLTDNSIIIQPCDPIIDGIVGNSFVFGNVYHNSIDGIEWLAVTGYDVTSINSENSFVSGYSPFSPTQNCGNLELCESHLYTVVISQEDIDNAPVYPFNISIKFVNPYGGNVQLGFQAAGTYTNSICVVDGTTQSFQYGVGGGIPIESPTSYVVESTIACCRDPYQLTTFSANTCCSEFLEYPNGIVLLPIYFPIGGSFLDNRGVCYVVIEPKAGLPNIIWDNETSVDDCFNCLSKNPCPPYSPPPNTQTYLVSGCCDATFTENQWMDLPDTASPDEIYVANDGFCYQIINSDIEATPNLYWNLGLRNDDCPKCMELHPCQLIYELYEVADCCTGIINIMSLPNTFIVSQVILDDRGQCFVILGLGGSLANVVWNEGDIYNYCEDCISINPCLPIPPIICGLGLTTGTYYYTDCCGIFIQGTLDGLNVSFDYTKPFGGITKLNISAPFVCSTTTPTPTPTITPTYTVTPTYTPTNTATPIPTITPSVTPSNTPVTRLKNDCDTITLFDMGISCNVIQSPTDSNPSGGVLSINVTGGTAPYTFNWEGGSHNQTLFGVPAGSYAVVVTDYSWPDGSPDYTATTICELLGPLPTSTPTSTPTPSPTSPVQCVDLCLIAIGTQGVPNIGPIQFVCNGTQNGRFKWTSGGYDIVWNINNSRWEIYIAGTTTPYLLEGGGIFASTTFNLIPDSAWTVLGGTDTYNSVTMTRGNCPTSIPLQVSINKTNSSCQGTTNCNGGISIFAQDGISPYSYSIDGGITFSINNTFTNLCPNTYTVVVYDSNNDSQTSTITIDYDSTPVTYQLSLANVGTATPITVPNVSQTITQQMVLVVTPELPVGVSVTFNLLSTALLTLNGPGSGTASVTWTVTKNNAPINVTIAPTTVSQGTRPNCSPSTQTIRSTNYSSSITISNGDVVNITSTTVDNINYGNVSAQSNCTTNVISEISAVISTPTIVGNTCSSVIGSSRQVQINNFTYVPTAAPIICNDNVARTFGVSVSQPYRLVKDNYQKFYVNGQSDFVVVFQSNASANPIGGIAVQATYPMKGFIAINTNNYNFLYAQNYEGLIIQNLVSNTSTLIPQPQYTYGLDAALAMVYNNVNNKIYYLCAGTNSTPEYQGRLEIVDLNTNTMEPRITDLPLWIPGSNAGSNALQCVNNILYWSSFGGNELVVFDCATNTIIDEIYLNSFVISSLTYKPSTNQLIIICGQGVTILDCDTNTIASQTPSFLNVFGINGQSAYNSFNNKVYANNNYNDDMSVYDLTTGILGTIPGWPLADANGTGVAVDNISNLIYVLQSQTNRAIQICGSPPSLLTNIITGYSRVYNNSGGQILFNPNSIEYIKCVYNNRVALGYNNVDGWAHYCDGLIQIGSQLYLDTTGIAPSTNTGYYVIDLGISPSSLTSNYYLNPPNSKFMIQLNNGVVVSITNFNSISNCAIPCTSC